MGQNIAEKFNLRLLSGVNRRYRQSTGKISIPTAEHNFYVSAKILDGPLIHCSSCAVLATLQMCSRVTR